MYNIYDACISIIEYLGQLAHKFTNIMTSPLVEILTDSILGTAISLVLPESLLGSSLLQFCFGGLITYVIAKLLYNFIKP